MSIYSYGVRVIRIQHGCSAEFDEGKGLSTEAARVVLNWGFWTHSLNKVCATCDPRNERSRRVLEKLGMAEERLLRRHLKWQGEFRDVLHYGILRSEWEAA